MAKQTKNALTSISCSIAAMFLEDAIKKGGGLEIPSLGIKIEGKKAKSNKLNKADCNAKSISD